METISFLSNINKISEKLMHKKLNSAIPDLNYGVNQPFYKISTMYRSSRPEVFCKKGVLRNFAKFTGKHLFQSLFFNKVAGRPVTLLKKRLWHRCFPVNFTKFLRTPFFIDHLWWLLLNVQIKILQ